MALVCAKSYSGNRILVVLDDVQNDKASYSKFLNFLDDHSYSVSVKESSDKSIALSTFDVANYDHIAFFAQTASSPELTSAKILEFINNGGNLLLAVSPVVSEQLREFAFEFSVDFDDRLTSARDPFASLSDDGLTFKASNYLANDYVLLPRDGTISKLSPVAFRGLAHRLTGKNPLAFTILGASPSTYSFLENNKNNDAIGESSPFIGSRISLVSAVQTRGNSRVVFSGSVKMFSDEFFDFENLGNQVFATELAKWTFQEKGVLRASNAKHHRQQENLQHGIYRIKDKMQYSVDISEYHSGSWHKFGAKDVQFQAVMLDPYILRTMTPKNGHFVVNYTLPDVYGVFTFKMQYWRHGLTYIETKDIVQVRPYRHDDYDRFLSAAWPYYVNVFSMMGAFLSLSAVWLFNKEKVEVIVAKKIN